MTSRIVLTLAAAVVFASALTGSSYASAQTADALFSQAKSAAQSQHKNVLMVFSASWCGPCKLYERFLQDPQMKPITEKAFVVQRIDVVEMPNDSKHSDTPGGVALRTALGASASDEPGFPFLIITDANGQPIVNSYRNGNTSDNIGYPAVPQEFDWYLEMLKRGAPSLSPADMAATRTWLQNHSPHH